MKHSVKRSLCVMLSLLMLLGCMMALPVSAQEDAASEDSSTAPAASQEEDGLRDSGSMNLDVMFVLDASGSMLTSDPNKIALDAFNLFADMCDDTCAVGYDVYTHKIKDSENLTSIKESESLDKMKKKIEKIVYDPSGDTDIALGLTKAMEMLDESTHENEYRRKAIVLLSDGNTDLPKGPRTVKESKAEMDKTLTALSEKNVPVYSIGLNCDKSLDKKEIDNISGKTGGKSYVTTNSDELTSIISDIFSNISEMNGIDCEIDDGNVKFEIKDSSVFYVNIIIRSKLSVNDLKPELTAPDGSQVDIKQNEEIKVTSTKSYTLLKIMYPQEGVWNMHLQKANKDNCSVKQLNFYSIFVRQDIDKDVSVGDILKISACLSDGKGVINDKDLLSTVEMTATVELNDEKRTVNLKKGTDGMFTGALKTDKTGAARITTEAVCERFTKVSSASFVSITEPVTEIRETTEEKEKQEEMMETIKKIIIGVVIGVLVVVVIIIAVIGMKQKKEKALIGSVRHVEEAPKPKPQKAAPVKTYVPKEQEPEAVSYTVLKHDKLENLIGKGTDDAFSTANADQFQADASLEGLIRKGTDDAFSTKNADQYQTDQSLESLIRKGTDDAFNAANADQYQTDEALEKLVRKGTDDAFNAANADQYQTDAALEKLVRKGSDDPFKASTSDYAVDPSLAALIRTGGDGLGVGKEEEHYDDDQSEE